MDHFTSIGFSVIRAAGSGVGAVCPDLLVFRRGEYYAIEAKAHEKTSLQIQKEQFEGLKSWQENTGITSLVAWRRNHLGWRFIPVNLFEENRKSYSFSWEKADMIGKKLEEF
jgi:Holliday junction resolvase